MTPDSNRPGALFPIIGPLRLRLWCSFYSGSDKEPEGILLRLVRASISKLGSLFWGPVYEGAGLFWGAQKGSLI